MLCEIKLANQVHANSIVQLLNKITLDLHEKGINQWTYPWCIDEIELDIKRKNIYMVIVDNLLIGTFSLRNVDNSWFPFVKQNSLYLYRIAILPEKQGKNVGIHITDYACRLSRNSQKTLYLDCWSGNEKLRDFYSKAGFDFLGNFPEADYFISVFKYK